MPDLSNLATRCESTTPEMQRELEEVFLPAINAGELAALAKDHPPLRRRCSGCAFTVGTSAHSDPATSAKRDDCVRRRHPFWCHMHKDQLDMPLHLCAGWMEHSAAILRACAEGEG